MDLLVVIQASVIDEQAMLLFESLEQIDDEPSAEVEFDRPLEKCHGRF